MNIAALLKNRARILSSSFCGSHSSRPRPLQTSHPAVVPQSKPIEEDFAFEREIGSGAFAKVWRARCRRTQNLVAVKVLKKSVNPHYLQEMELMQRVSHEFVVPLLEAYATEEDLHLVIPLYTGQDLFDFIDGAYAPGAPGVSETDALVMAAQMLSAAEACHMAGVAHLDIKPENFMFAHKAVGSDLVLVDFGSAEAMSLAPYAVTSADYDPTLDDRLTLERLDRVAGTANYISPEVADGRFSSRSDVFSVGVTLYSLLSGLAPFRTDQMGGRREQIRHLCAAPDVNLPEWERVSEQCKDTSMWMLRPDPQLRCSTTEALEAITAVLDMLESMERAQRAFDRFTRTVDASNRFRGELRASVDADTVDGKEAPSLYELGRYGKQSSLASDLAYVPEKGMKGAVIPEMESDGMEVSSEGTGTACAGNGDATRGLSRTRSQLDAIDPDDISIPLGERLAARAVRNEHATKSVGNDCAGEMTRIRAAAGRGEGHDVGASAIEVAGPARELSRDIHARKERGRRTIQRVNSYLKKRKQERQRSVTSSLERT